MLITGQEQEDRMRRGSEKGKGPQWNVFYAYNILGYGNVYTDIHSQHQTNRQRWKGGHLQCCC